MEPQEARRRFAQIVLRPDEEFDLAEAALLVAVEDYPDLEPETYLRQLEEMAQALTLRVGADRDPYHVIAALNSYLFDELGFSGNETDYYNPRNSYLHETLERRTGMPVTLSLIYLELAHRVGLQLMGVGFPARFLVKYQAPEVEILLDPFERGRIVTEEECAQELRRVYGPRARFSPELLAASSPKSMLARLLKNLEGLYLQRRDYPHAYAAVDRILLLQPDAPAELRERGLIAFRMADFAQALRDLRRYLWLQPQARDRGRIQNQLRLARRMWSMRN